MTDADGGLCGGTCNARYREAQAVYTARLAEYDDALAGYAQLAAGKSPAGQMPERPVPPEKPDIRPWYGEPVWCRRCARLIRAELAELDDLAAWLANLPPGIRAAIDDRREREKISGTPEHQSPSPAADDLDELERWLLGAETGWRQRHGWSSAPRRGDLATTRTSVIGWLGDKLGGILASDLGEEFGLGVRRWHRVLRSKTHAASYARHVKQPCPGCRRFSLWERVGEVYIACAFDDCGRRITREELDAVTGP